MRRAIYAGSFDPPTFGHLDVIRRGAALFDELVVGILVNNAKQPLFSAQERAKMLKEQLKPLRNVNVLFFEGLLAEFADRQQADVLLRGVRSGQDFEYELPMAQMNGMLGTGLDTIFLPAKPQYACISSSAVKEIAAFGGDVSQFVPAEVMQKLQERYQKDRRVSDGS